MSNNTNGNLLTDYLYIWIPNLLSVFMCTKFFVFYFQRPYKTISLKMILILCISDLICHITGSSSLLLTILALRYPEHHLLNVFSNILYVTFEIAFHFSIFWACNIAFFIYKLFKKNKKKLNISNYHLSSSAVLLLLSVVVSAINLKLQGSNPGLILYCACFVITSLLTIYFYCWSIFIVKQESDMVAVLLKVEPKDFYIYSLVQLATIVPLIFLFVFDDISDLNRYIEYLCYSVMSLGGFFNCLVFFYLRKDTLNPQFISNQLDRLSHETIEMGKDGFQSFLTN